MKKVVVILVLLCGLVGNAQTEEWFKSGELTKYRSEGVELSIAFGTMIIVMHEYDYSDNNREFVASSEDYSINAVALREVGSDDVYIFNTMNESGFEGQFAYRLDDTEYPMLEIILRKLFRGDKEMVFTVIYVRKRDDEYLSKEIRLNSLLHQIENEK